MQGPHGFLLRAPHANHGAPSSARLHAQQPLHRHEVNISIQHVTADGTPEIVRRAVRHVRVPSTCDHHMPHSRRAEGRPIDGATPGGRHNESAERVAADAYFGGVGALADGTPSPRGHRVSPRRISCGYSFPNATPL